MLLLILIDGLAIRDIVINQKENYLKIFYISLVLLIPIAGFSLYYMIRSIKLIQFYAVTGPTLLSN